MSGGNTVPGGFLETHRRANRGEVRYLPLVRGYLKLEYGLYHEQDILSRVSYVLDDAPDSMAVGRRLEFFLSLDRRGDRAVFIAEHDGDGWMKPEDFGRD